MHSTLLLTLRRLRAPLILLIVVFAIGMVGLLLIPGVDEEGRPWHMSMFQAFYFMSYTASTIGFGEIPAGFTDRQRLWVTVIIYGAVFGWAYLVASLLALARDKALRRTLVESNFRRGVKGLVQPFYLICGFGETGQLVAKALDLRGRRFTVLEIDETRAQEVDLMDFWQVPLVLAADARLPDNLVAAGLRKDNCRGVLAITNDDQANLSAAMTVKLLEPNVPVIARAMSRETVDNMHSFGTNHIINPFARFGEQLALAIAAPANYRLISWLTGLPGTHLAPETSPPRGAWVVCGYGRFGREVVQAFHAQGLEVTVIDPVAAGDPGMPTVRGLGTEATPLRAAGIESAVGIVAGTDDDVNNLSIVVTARELNAGLFTIVRQNNEAYHALFEAFDADMTMVSSELIASECLSVIRTPLLVPFLRIARAEDEDWAAALTDRLQETIGERAPAMWSVTLNISEAPAVYRCLMQAGRVAVADLLRHPAQREERLPCVPLYLRRAGKEMVLPPDDYALAPGDEVLFAGRSSARNLQQSIRFNEKVFTYALSGDQPRRLGRRQPRASAS